MVERPWPRYVDRGRPADPACRVVPKSVRSGVDRRRSRYGARGGAPTSASSPDIRSSVSPRRRGGIGGAGAQPDVVLMDLVMPTMDGVDATSRIKHHRPRRTSSSSRRFWTTSAWCRAIKAGRRATCSKTSPHRSGAPSRRARRPGQLHRSGSTAHAAGTSPRKPEADALLTEREREVLRLLAEVQQLKSPAPWWSASAPSKATSPTSSANWAGGCTKPPSSPSATASPRITSNSTRPASCVRP